jgi:E3 ubiquitin-protein ligase listerin
MYHLLTDSSVDVQKTTYHVLQESARKWTEHLVIEAGVDTEGTSKIELPSKLLEFIQQSIPFEKDAEHDEQVCQFGS